MKRYSIDEPVKLDDLSDGEDLVYSSGPVTEDDRQLLQADDEVVKALDKKSPVPSPILSTTKKFMPKKKVKFGGEYHRLSEHRSSQKAPRPEPIFSYGDDTDESESEIEIDLEATGKKRRRNTAFRRKMHIFLFLVVLLGGLLFFSNVLQPANDDHKTHNTTAKKLLSNGTHDFHPTTVMISLDGFHPHYINKELTPNLHELFTQKSGVPYMKPSFPTSTFPNHWTLVTGLYPGNHGIVGNTFYDTKEERQFYNTKPDQSLQLFWWGGEPIWQTLARQNIGTAVHMWPGSEAPWKVGKPMEVDKFNGSELLSAKSKRVFEWLDRDIKTRPELILTYVPTVDSIGHEFGISGQDLKNALSDVDKLIGDLRTGIQKRNLGDIVNFVVVSDHGMSPTSNDRLTFLEDLVDLNDLAHVDGWPLMGIRPKDGVSVKDMYESIKAKEPEDKSWKVFTADNLPESWNFGSHSIYSSRIAPLFIIPAIGWAITTRDDLKRMGGVYQPHGVHGYDNNEVLMRATFLAEGPYFKNKGAFEPIPNTDLYNIICDTFNANPAKNDGRDLSKSLKPLKHGWTDPQPYPGVHFQTEILKINSTYDILYGHKSEGDDSKSTSDETWSEWFKDMADSAKDKLEHAAHEVEEMVDDIFD